MRTKVSDDVRKILEKTQQAGLESKFNVGDIILVGSSDKELQNYICFGRVIIYESDSLMPFQNPIPTLGKGYSINIITPPEVEILRAENDTRFVKNFTCYRLDAEELSKIVNLLKETELAFFNSCFATRQSQIAL